VNVSRTTIKAALAIILALSILLPVLAFAGEINLAWDPSTDQVDGYKLHCGPTTKTYGTPTDVKNVTQYTLSAPPGQYFCAVSAYKGTLESAFSNELVFNILPSAPRQFRIVLQITLDADGAPTARVVGLREVGK
jgi:hypothetical protein